MRRRAFLCGSGTMLAAPFGAEAQEPRKVPRVGFLGPRSRSDGPFVGAFLQGLRELGWVEGRNIAIEYRFAEGKLERLPDLAAELVRLKVDVILATSSPPALAAKKRDENNSHRYGDKR